MGHGLIPAMNNFREFYYAPQHGLPVRGFLHHPTDPVGDCLVLTHGAGANCNSPLLVALANAFCASGLTVLRCDLPFRQLRPHGPPQRGSAELDQQGLRTGDSSGAKFQQLDLLHILSASVSVIWLVLPHGYH